MFCLTNPEISPCIYYQTMSDKHIASCEVTFVLPIYKPRTNEQEIDSVQSDLKMPEIERPVSNQTKSMMNPLCNSAEKPIERELKRSLLGEEELSQTSQLIKEKSVIIESQIINQFREFWKKYERFESRRVNNHEGFERLLDKDSVSIEVFWLLIKTRFFEDTSDFLGKLKKMVGQNLEKDLGNKKGESRKNSAEAKKGVQIDKRGSGVEFLLNYWKRGQQLHLQGNKGSLKDFQRVCMQWVRKLIKMNRCLLNHESYHAWLVHRLLTNLKRKGSGISIESKEEIGVEDTFKSPNNSELILKLQEKQLQNCKKIEQINLKAEKNRLRLFSNNFVELLKQTCSRFQSFYPSKRSIVYSPYPLNSELKLERKYLEELQLKKQEEHKNETIATSIFVQSSLDVCQVCNSGDSIEINKLVYCSVK